MIIRVEIMGWLKKFAQGNARVEIQIDKGQKVLDLIRICNIPRDEIGIIALRNSNLDSDKLVDDRYELTKGDIIVLYSPIVGG